MTAPARAPFTAFLLRAGLMTAALAIISGIFGMHIMTGAHSMSAAHPMPAAAAEPTVHLQNIPALHSHAPHAPPGGVAAAQTVTGSSTGTSSSCAPSGSCPEMSAGGNTCVLSPGNTSLSAPAPGTTPYALPDFGAAAASTYAYSPASPSPGDLCISRT